MFRVMLWNQWRWSRLVILMGSIGLFAIPILSVQGARTGAGGLPPGELLGLLRTWAILYPLVAGALGLLVAMAAWAPDHRGRHVHTLSLPIERWRFLLLRFSAGLTLLAVPVLALLIGALLATHFATIPSGLQAYPFSLALRFGLALLIAFALFFAISGGTARTAGIILGLFAAVIVIQVMASSVGLGLDLITILQAGFLTWPGPLAIFTGRWMLIDV
jgi:hypothetical protein